MNAALTTNMHTWGTVAGQRETRDTNKALGTVLLLYACEKKARSGPSKTCLHVMSYVVCKAGCLFAS
jgi:hypothetical protein